MTAVVVRGDAAHLPLPDGSVDLVICSPPYFGLRSYSDAGQHYDGQIGSESTPQEYLEALWACTREWVRVLKPGGSIFVNLGDKYNSAASGQKGTMSRGGIKWPVDPQGRRYPTVDGIREKSLLGLPWRYAIGCTDRLGLILRAEIVWAKPNGLPESVTDRVRRAHEQIFHMTKLPRYYSAVDEVREEATSGPHGAARASRRDTRADAAARWPGRHEATDYRTERDHHAMNPLGKLPGSVWPIPSQPLTVPDRLGIDHFAAFPCELPRRVILGWSPPGVCTACGEGRRPVTDRETRPTQRVHNGYTRDDPMGARGGMVPLPMRSLTTITGYACACPQPDAPTRPALVVDPFGGTGTTALVAAAYGRTGVTVDRSADYCRLARWRCSDPGERARALGVPKPPPVPDGQGSLFDGEAV